MSTRQLLPAKPAAAPPPSLGPVCRGLLQRTCACGDTSGPTGECGDCTKKLQRHTRDPRLEPRNDRSIPPIVREVLGSSGQPLDSVTRAFMEPRFGHDMSGVRVHSDAQAAESARAVNALAYTVGRDVVFGAAQYAPATARGRALLAHELAHVVQQASTSASHLLEIGDADSPAEREAAAAAQTLSTGQAGIQAQPHMPIQIARQRDGGPAAAGAPTTTPSRVNLVRVSCESNTIEFETNAGVYTYELVDCDIRDADYTATVKVTGSNVDFGAPPDAPASHARFRYSIAPGQPNPSTFLRGQTAVHMVTGTVSRQPSSNRGPASGPSPGTGRGPQVCSRPLDFPPWTGLRDFRHAFVNDPPANYAIRKLISGDGVTTSCTEKTDASGSPDDIAGGETICKPCEPDQGRTVADVSNCLRAAYSAYAQPNLYRNLPDPGDGWKHGPNSNSFGAAMAKCCANFNPAGLGNLPGWDHGPAGPCRAVQAAEEPVPETGPSDAGVPLPGGLPEPGPTQPDVQGKESDDTGGEFGGGGASGSWTPAPAPGVSPPPLPPPAAPATAEAQKLDFYHGTRWSIAKQIPKNVKPLGGGDFAAGFYTHYDADSNKALKRATEWGRAMAQKPPPEAYAGVVRFGVGQTDYLNLFAGDKGKTFDLKSIDQPDYAARQKEWLDFVTSYGREKEPQFIKRRSQWVHARRARQPALGYNVIAGPFYAPLRGTSERKPAPKEFKPYAEGRRLPQQVVWAEEGIKLLNSTRVQTELLQFDAKTGKRQDPPVDVANAAPAQPTVEQATEETQLELPQ